METFEAAERISKIGIFWTAIFIGIGLGMTIWLGYFIQHHNWDRQISQEKRAAEWVGEKEPPRAAIKIVVKNSGCLHIERAQVDADHASVILRRICGVSGDYAELHWRQLANDTVIGGNLTNWGVDEVGAGEMEDFSISNYDPSFAVDPRTTEIILETRGSRY